MTTVTVGGKMDLENRGRCSSGLEPAITDLTLAGSRAGKILCLRDPPRESAIDSNTLEMGGPRGRKTATRSR